MKLEIKSNFSFANLSQKLPKILEKHLQRTARSSAQGAREVIESGKLTRLAKSTIERRKRRGTGGSKPLFETGSLFRSIKATSEGLKMNEYGMWHHTGNKRPERPFITPSRKTILKSIDAFKKDLRKGMRK